MKVVKNKKYFKLLIMQCVVKNLKCIVDELHEEKMGDFVDELENMIGEIEVENEEERERLFPNLSEMIYKGDDDYCLAAQYIDTLIISKK